MYRPASILMLGLLVPALFLAWGCAAGDPGSGETKSNPTAASESGAPTTSSVSDTPPEPTTPGENQGSPAVYSCPMHPEVREPNPGKCPKCGMALVQEKDSQVQPGSAATQPATTYTCPMHPEIRQPTPGRCPKCGMTLSPVEVKEQ